MENSQRETRHRTIFSKVIYWFNFVRRFLDKYWKYPDNWVQKQTPEFLDWCTSVYSLRIISLKVRLSSLWHVDVANVLRVSELTPPQELFRITDCAGDRTLPLPAAVLTLVHPVLGPGRLNCTQLPLAGPPALCLQSGSQFLDSLLARWAEADWVMGSEVTDALKAGLWEQLFPSSRFQ